MKQVKTFLRRYLLFIVIIVCLLFMLKCNRDKITYYRDLITVKTDSFAVVINDKDEKIVSQDQVIIEQKDAIRTGLLDNERLKEINIRSVQSQVRLKEQVVYYKKLAEAKDKPPTVIYVDSSHNSEQITGNYMLLPQSYLYKDNYTRLVSTIDISGLQTFDTIAFTSIPTVTIGTKRIKGVKRLWKKTEYTVVYTNENPNIVISEMNNVVITAKRPFYKKGWFWGVVGFFGGFAFASF